MSETTYGEPAGIWGINCGHSCNVFIHGLSIIRGESPPQDENDKRYTESQQQRQLEREIRYAKRDAAVAKASNDKESFDKAARSVKQTQANLDSFLSETGRAPSVARTQVVGYNRSATGSVTWANAERATHLEYIKIGAYAEKVSNNGLTSVVKLADTTLKQTSDVNFPTIHAVVPKGVEVSSVVAIAGSGTSTPINDIARLVNTYPSFGKADDWQKVIGVVNGTYFRYEVHWYECNGKVPVKEIKTKGVKSIR